MEEPKIENNAAENEIPSQNKPIPARDSLASDFGNQEDDLDTSINEESHVDPDQSIGDMSAMLQSAELEGKKALNWKRYLKDEKVALDALKFQKGRKSIAEDHVGINKDLPRTRPEDPYFSKPSNKSALKEIAVFYCNSNNICYQQGLLEIIVPFLKLRTATFRTKHCYAYFSSFMRNFFPNILIPTVVNDLRELPHLNAAINYCAILLNYHATQVADILKKRDLDLRTFVTPWVLTLFCKGTNMDLVYEIFDKYMAEKDKLFLFYMVVALIVMNEGKIVEVHETDDDVKIITFLNRELKEESITTSEQVQRLFQIAKRIKELTPLSFETSLKQLGLMDVGILSIQEFNEFLAQNIQLRMEIYPFEIVNFLLEKTALNAVDKEKLKIYPKEIEFRLLDCRKIKSSLILPFTLELPDGAFKSKDILKSSLAEIFKEYETYHICIIKSQTSDKEEQAMVENVTKILKDMNKNYVSTVLGGYQAIMKEMEQRKVNVPLSKRKRPSLLDKLKSLFN